MNGDEKGFTYAQVSAHNTSNDSWLIINGKVYNVTRWLNEHPGGDEVLLGQAGKDASEEFEGVGHGSSARLMLDEFYVGEINRSSMEHPAKDMDPSFVPPSGVENKSYGFTSNFYLYLVLAGAIVALVVGMVSVDFWYK